MKKILYIVSFIWLGIVAFAQTADGRFQVIQNDGTNYAVKIQIKLQSGSVAMGDASLRFTYNPSALSFPMTNITAGTHYTYHNFSGGSYYDGTVSSTMDNEISLNITYNSGNATQIGTDYIDVATVYFAILDPMTSVSLDWTSKEVYAVNTVTPLNEGMWINENTTMLPVELKSFSATADMNSALLKWQTATELNNFGFEIERRQSNETAVWSKVGFVKGSGNSVSPRNYEFTDKSISGGNKFEYRLKQVDNDGTFTYSETSVVELLPQSFEMMQNYPNPFNPSTKIKYTLPNDSRVSMTVFNTIGEVVEVIENAVKPAGIYEVNWNASGYASGIYLCRIEARTIDGTKSFSNVKKMVLTK